MDIYSPLTRMRSYFTPVMRPAALETKLLKNQPFVYVYQC